MNKYDLVVIFFFIWFVIFVYLARTKGQSELRSTNTANESDKSNYVQHCCFFFRLLERNKRGHLDDSFSMDRMMTLDFCEMKKRIRDR